MVLPFWVFFYLARCKSSRIALSIICNSQQQQQQKFEFPFGVQGLPQENALFYERLYFW